MLTKTSLTVARLGRIALLLLGYIPRVGGQFSLPPSLNDFMWAKHPTVMPLGNLVMPLCLIFVVTSLHHEVVMSCRPKA